MDPFEVNDKELWKLYKKITTDINFTSQKTTQIGRLTKTYLAKNKKTDEKYQIEKNRNFTDYVMQLKKLRDEVKN